MADGGFLVRIDGKELCRGYSIKFDYDEWTYSVNNGAPAGLPKIEKGISVEVEEG